MVNQVQPQEETGERFRKTKFIILTGPRDRRPSTALRATWRSTREGIRRHKTGVRGMLRP